MRLVEGTGGSVTGELRVGLPHRAADAQLVARSDVLIRPVAIVEATTLVYVIAVERGVELRAREITSGAERVLAVGQISAAGVVPFRNAAHSGSWIAWVEETSAPTSTVRAIDLKGGATRDVPLGQSYCPMLTANDRYLALNCSAQQGQPRMVLIDTRSWTELPVAQTTSNGPFFLAAGGMTELLWQDRFDGRQRVIRFVPTAPIAAPADGPFRDLVPRENAALGYRLSLPARYRLAHSVAEPGNVGTDYYTPRTEEEMREACRAGGFGLQQATDVQVVVQARGGVVSPVDAVRHTLFTATERLAVSGYDAARVVNLPSGETAYYVISANDRLYEITPAVGSQPAPPELTSSGFDQIVSTFTAIPIVPVSAAPPRRTLCGT